MEASNFDWLQWGFAGLAAVLLAALVRFMGAILDHQRQQEEFWTNAYQETLRQNTRALEELREAVAQLRLELARMSGPE